MLRLLAALLTVPAAALAQPSVSMDRAGLLAVDGSAPAADMARAVAAATRLRVDGIEHLDGSIVTLHFQRIEPATVLQLVAGEGGSLLLRSGEHFAFAAPAQAARLRAGIEAVEAAQASGDEAALDAALPPLLALLRPPASGPAFTGYGFWEIASARAEERGDLAQAESLAREQLAHMERLHGANERAAYGLALGQLARLQLRQGESEAATAAFERAIAIASGELGPAHPDLARLQMFLGNLYRDAGREDEAERAYRAAIASFDAGAHGDEVWLAATLDALAALYLARERPQLGVPLYERSVALQRATHGADTSALDIPLYLLGEALWLADRLPRAAEVLAELTAAGDGRRIARNAAPRLAAIRALGPFTDPAAEPDAARLAALRGAFAALPGDEARFHALDVLGRRAAAAFRSDPASPAGMRACVLYAEVDTASYRRPPGAGEVQRAREECRATAIAGDGDGA